jgi:hypothetical protein
MEEFEVEEYLEEDAVDDRRVSLHRRMLWRMLVEYTENAE